MRNVKDLNDIFYTTKRTIPLKVFGVLEVQIWFLDGR